MTTRRPRARTVTEDPARWDPCPRCRRSYQRARTWPEGRVCHYCASAALRTVGRCASCGHEGILPGLDEHNAATCVACSGIPAQVHCRRCGLEAPLGRSNSCWSCLLQIKLEALLAGPDGTIAAPLTALAAALAAMPSPNSAHAWLSNPEVAGLLRRLGGGELALTHAALDELPAGRTIEHLRGLLMTQGCLPARDPHLAGFEHWLALKLEAIAEPENRGVIDRFARWHLLRQLRARTAQGPISDGTFLNAKQTTTVAGNFLTWLSTRDVALEQLTQHDIDGWFAAGPSTRKHAVRFLYWAREQRLINASLEVPVPRTNQPTPLSAQQRLALLHRVLLEADLSHTIRVAAALVLLFGMTPRQITAITVDDLVDDGEHTWLRIAEHPVPLPEPLAQLLDGLAADPRYRRNTANHDSPLLFPGTRPGRAILPSTLAEALKRANIPVQPTRAGAWLELVRNAPAPLLADALGISAVTAARYAERAGTDYATYSR